VLVRLRLRHAEVCMWGNTPFQILLSITTVALFIAQQQKSEMNRAIPRDADCDATLPAASYQTHAFPSDAKLTRNRTADAVCGPNRFLIYYRSEDHPDLFRYVGAGDKGT